MGENDEWRLPGDLTQEEKTFRYFVRCTNLCDLSPVEAPTCSYLRHWPM
jgi:hypothetical protein